MNKTLPRPYVKSVAAFCLLASTLIGCGGPQLARYDVTTYQNITFEKPEVLALYDTFRVDPINENKFNDVDLKLAQIREYEAGKGPGNVDMTQQIESIKSMFEKHVAERRRDGPWNEANLGNHKDAISDAFDVAIKTEQAKNK
jgi:hypothetical protein